MFMAKAPGRARIISLFCAAMIDNHTDNLAAERSSVRSDLVSPSPPCLSLMCHIAGRWDDSVAPWLAEGVPSIEQLAECPGKVLLAEGLGQEAHAHIHLPVLPEHILRVT